MVKNFWKTERQKKQVRDWLANLIDETLLTTGYYAGCEMGHISEAEQLRTYQALADVMHCLTEELCRN